VSKKPSKEKILWRSTGIYTQVGVFSAAPLVVEVSMIKEI